MNNCEYDIKIQVVHILLKKKFQEKETKCVKSVIDEMKEWYENKIKEEKKEKIEKIFYIKKKYL